MPDDARESLIPARSLARECVEAMDEQVAGTPFAEGPWEHLGDAYRDMRRLADALDTAVEAFEKIGEFASAHSGRDGQDVLLAALYRIAEECEALL